MLFPINALIPNTKEWDKFGLRENKLPEDVLKTLQLFSGISIEIDENALPLDVMLVRGNPRVLAVRPKNGIVQINGMYIHMKADHQGEIFIFKNPLPKN